MAALLLASSSRSVDSVHYITSVLHHCTLHHYDIIFSDLSPAQGGPLSPRISSKTAEPLRARALPPPDSPGDASPLSAQREALTGAIGEELLPYVNIESVSLPVLP